MKFSFTKFEVHKLFSSFVGFLNFEKLKPSNFNFSEAAENIGCNVLRVISEPAAALLAYGEISLSTYILR